MRRVLVLLAMSGLVATGVVVVVGTAPEAGATGTRACALDPATGTLTITSDSSDDIGADVNEITIARTPDTDHDPDVDNGTFEVLAGDTPLDCLGATVNNVDTVVVRLSGADVFHNGGLFFYGDDFSITIDQRNGRFAPGKDHQTKAGDPPVYRDVFAPGLEEDATPEIEFDLHYPHDGLGSAFNLEILGTEDPERVILGSRACTTSFEPLCRDFNVNLDASNADADADADLGVTYGEGYQVHRAGLAAYNLAVSISTYGATTS